MRVLEDYSIGIHVYEGGYGDVFMAAPRSQTALVRCGSAQYVAIKFLRNALETSKSLLMLVREVAHGELLSRRDENGKATDNCAVTLFDVLMLEGSNDVYVQTHASLLMFVS